VNPSNSQRTPRQAPGQKLQQRLACLALVLTSCLCTSAYGLTQSFQKWADTLGIDMSVQYQATRVITTKEGTFEFSERRVPQKMLMDIKMEGAEAVLLLREDLGKSYVLMPSLGMYREMPMDKANQQAGGVDGLDEVTKVGRETVNGYDCTKFKARISSKEGKGDGFIWVTDSGVPLKMDMVYSSRRKRGQHMVMELKDLQLTPQDSALFELPKNLKPFGLRGLGKLFQR
jgi:hypothetical protein